MTDRTSYSIVIHRIDRLEHDMRELAQCIVFMCECMKDIHSKSEQSWKIRYGQSNHCNFTGYCRSIETSGQVRWHYGNNHQTSSGWIYGKVDKERLLRTMISESTLLFIILRSAFYFLHWVNYSFLGQGVIYENYRYIYALYNVPIVNRVYFGC